ncbi:MAG TPA: outer membrane beta-barrel protein [Flavobacterium sp.]|jgi:hypothetical protein
MKKLLLVSVFTLFAAAQINAQVTFRPGIRAGANFAYFTEGDSFDDDGFESDAEFNAKTDFYIGFYGALKLSRFYTLQPEINYSRQGSNIDFANGVDMPEDIKIDVSYLSVVIINKFTFGEKFNVHLGPTLDFVVERPDNVELESDVDFGFAIGAGYNFTNNIGLEARIKKGIIPVIDTGEYHTNVVLSVGATYTFDIK